MAQVIMFEMFLFLTVVGTKVIINAQFLEQPIAGSVFVPVIDRVTLSCSVNEAYAHDNYTIDWEVRFDNGVPIRAALRRNDATFIQRSFIFTGVETSTSTLTFGIEDEMGNQTNNATTITCVARLGISEREPGNTVQVIFYSTPPPPTDLNVAEDELGSLNISWSLEFIERVPVNYTLVVLNLNTTSAQPIIIAGLLDQHYLLETSVPCDVYSFTVTAVTAAGNSTPSQEIIFTKNNSNSILCVVTTVQISTTNATTFTGNTGFSEGAIAGIATGISAIIIIGIMVIIIIIIAAVLILNHDAVSIDVRNLRDARQNQEIRISLTIRTTTIPDIQCSLELTRSNRPVERAFIIEESPRRRIVVVTPQEQGRHKLAITSNEQHIKGSPFHFEVEAELNNYSLEIPLGLSTSHDKVFAVERGGQRIQVFRNRNPDRIIHVQEDNLTDITVHNTGAENIIFVTTGKGRRVLKLNSQGEVIASNKSLRYPNGLCIKSNNELYVCDTKASNIQVFSLNLELQRIVTGENYWWSRSFKQPRDVAFDNDNYAYVAESNKIRVLSPGDTFVRTIGRGKLKDVSSLEIVNDFIYVASDKGLSLYCTDGTHIRNFFKQDILEAAPRGITVDNDNYVYASFADGRVRIFA